MGDLDLIRNNMLSHYPLGEVSGTRVDFIGANDLTDVNTVGQAAGKIGNAASFVSANTEYLTISAPASLSFGDEDFTIAGWFFLQSKATNMSFVSKFDFTANDREYALNYNTSADRFQFLVSATGGSFSVLVANNFGAVPTGQFIFVVAWHDSVANTINIQVNDGTINSASFSTGVNAGNSPFRISNLGSTSPVQLIDGRADEVTVWDRVVSAAELTAIFNGTTGVDLTSQFFSFSLAADADFATEFIVFNGALDAIGIDLVSYWPVSEAAGNSRLDDKAANDMAETGGTVGQGASIVTNADANSASFDGSVEHLEKTSPTGVNLGAGSFTIAFWARIDGTLTSDQGGMSKFDPTGNQRQFTVFFFGATSQTWRFGVSSDGADDFGLNDDDVISATGEVHFVVAWYDGDADTINIVLDDGVVQSAAGPTSVFGSTSPLEIGNLDVTVDRVFNGLIDEPAFWARKLSPSEITGMYNSGAGVNLGNLIGVTLVSNVTVDADFTASLSVERSLASTLQVDADFTQDLQFSALFAANLTSDADFTMRLSVNEVFFELGMQVDADFAAALGRPRPLSFALQTDANFAAKHTVTDFFAFFDPETTALTSQMG